jgi:hypothetical protein
LRGLFIITSIIHKLWLAQKFGIDAFIFYNIPTFLADYLLLYEWYYHSILSIIESLAATCLLQNNAASTIIIILWKTSISTAIYCCFERLAKENWVLYETFKKSYAAFTRLVDTTPQIISVVNKKGEIDYFNKAFTTSFGNIKASSRKHLKPRIFDFIKETDLQLFSESFAKAIKGEKSILTVELGITSFDCYEVSMCLFQWKQFKSVLITAHNISSQRKIITEISHQLSIASVQIDSILTPLESLYTTDKQIHKKIYTILEKVQKFRQITDASYIYGAMGFGWKISNGLCFDLKQMTKYFIEIMANDAFGKNISIKLTLENSFPEDVYGNLMLLRSLVSTLLKMLINECKDTCITINGLLKVKLLPECRK